MIKNMRSFRFSWNFLEDKFESYAMDNEFLKKKKHNIFIYFLSVWATWEAQIIFTFLLDNEFCLVLVEYYNIQCP